jgi:hypothetical protein
VSQVLPSRGLQGQQGYYVEGFKIIYDDDELGTKNKMTLKIPIAAPDAVGLDAPLPVIPEQQAMIISKVIEDMGMQAAASHDDINDFNSPEITAK